jgi:predicted ArsR family transcriptional regulator
MRKAATKQAAAVLHVLRAYGPLGAEEIGARLGLDAYAVRKRLPELQDANLACPLERTRQTASGRSERVWEAV